jgi:hypothetical protein
MDISVFAQPLAEFVVAVVSIVIARYLVPWLKHKYTGEKVQNTYDIIVKAVQAAEKIYQESGTGKLKKEYVIAYVKKMGIEITDEELDMFIESAVKLLDVMKNEIKK